MELNQYQRMLRTDARERLASGVDSIQVGADLISVGRNLFGLTAEQCADVLSVLHREDGLLYPGEAE